jgi:hypothetical protein
MNCGFYSNCAGGRLDRVGREADNHFQIGGGGLTIAFFG